MDDSITIPIMNAVRTVNFASATVREQGDPYIIGHLDLVMLGPDMLRSMRHTYNQEHPRKLDNQNYAEHFEAFVEWLCRERGYFLLVTIGETVIL